jgi:hypothetical protein
MNDRIPAQWDGIRKEKERDAEQKEGEAGANGAPGGGNCVDDGKGMRAVEVRDQRSQGDQQ